METSEILQKIGMVDKEAVIYLALIELGTAPVERIATKANTKRATTYFVLRNLEKRGLVSQVPQNKKVLYTAESPEKLLQVVYKHAELMKRALPGMLALYNEKKEKPQVQLYNGAEGIRQVYEKIYQAKEVWFFGTIGEAAKLYPEGLQDFFIRTKQEGIRIKDILTVTPENLAYARGPHGIVDHEVKFIPPEIDFPVSDSAVFGDSVVFFSFQPHLFAVTMTSREVAGTIKALFELSWRSALLLEQIKK
jgi:sugar-specific transcriptional regulator TrmB